MALLSLTHILMGAAALLGLIFLAGKRLWILTAAQALALAALVAQAGWFIYAGMSFPYCALLDPWGVISLFTTAVIVVGLGSSLRYRSPRIMIWSLLLGSIAVTFCWLMLPPAGSSPLAMGWLLAFHILLTVLGVAWLGIGFVSGALLTLRSRLLKSGQWEEGGGARWPSLVALDRLFVRSVGVGAALLAAGVFLGIAVTPGVSLSGPWYQDPKVILAVLSLGLYSAVWHLRRRQGFASATAIGLSSLGFAAILFGLLATGLFKSGFHKF